MPYKVPELEKLIGIGLNAREFYQRDFLYMPQPSKDLINQLTGLEEAYLKSKEIEESTGTRKLMLQFLVDMTKAIGTLDEEKEKSLITKLATFISYKAEDDSQEKAEIDKQKAWILTAALIFIRYKLVMEHEPQAANIWGVTFFGMLKKPDPKNSVLYLECGKLLHEPPDPMVNKPLYDDLKSDDPPPNYFALVQSLTALCDFIAKMDEKPKYLTLKEEREKQLGEFKDLCEQSPEYEAIKIHLTDLEKQEKVISSIYSVFQKARVAIEKLPEETYESLSTLRDVVSRSSCHVSVKTLIDWSITQIENSEEESTDPLVDQLETMLDYVSGNLIVGAQFLLRSKFEVQKNKHNKPIIQFLNDSIGYTKTNGIDFSDSKDIECLKSALTAYKDMAATFPDLAVHNALWGDVGLERAVEVTIKNLDQIKEDHTAVPMV